MELYLDTANVAEVEHWRVFFQLRVSPPTQAL